MWVGIKNSVVNTDTYKRLIENYRQDISGQFAIIFALLSSLLLLSVAAAIDVSSLISSKQQAQNVIDSSVMATARSYQLESDKVKAKKAGRKIFKSQCNYIWCDKKNVPTYKIKADSKNGFTVSATYEGKNDSILMGIFGPEEMSFKNLSVAGFNNPDVFQEIQFVIDWSASLGIASTPTEQSQLKALTKPFVDFMPGAEDGCAFACHMPESFIKPLIGGVEVNTYDFARANGINLREDDMAAAIDSVVENLFKTASISTTAGIYAISDQLEQVKAPTNQSFSTLSELDGVNMPRYGTRFDIALPALASQLGVSGTGSTAVDPVKAIVLVTDGLNNNYAGGIQTSAFQSSYCAGLKANGIKVAVLHLPYPDLAGQDWYESFAKPHLSDIPGALEACASNGLYFEADQSDEISTLLGVITDTITDVQLQELAFLK